MIKTAEAKGKIVFLDKLQIQPVGVNNYCLIHFINLKKI